MSDLINRQEAIEAIEMICNTPCNKYFVNAIKALPSANQWIPCKESLPEVGKMVLTINFHFQCNVLSITEFETWHDWDDCFVNDYIIAWMPLPELYREEQ